MSKLSDLIIESQETGKPVNRLLNGKQKTTKTSKPRSAKAKTQAKATHPSAFYATYWRLCLKVVDAAGELAAKDKLLMNYRDPAKRHNVKDVVEKEYTPTPAEAAAGVQVNPKTCLADARNDVARYFFTCMDQLNEFSIEHEFDQAYGMALIGTLVDADVRRKFRYHINKHIETEHPPFALDELPGKDFRKTIKTAETTNSTKSR